MYEYEVRIRNGTGGWHDCCDKFVASMRTVFLPRKGEVIEIKKEHAFEEYLVTQVRYWYASGTGNSGIDIYVVPARL